MAKGIPEFTVVFLQLMCTFEIVSKQKVKEKTSQTACEVVYPRSIPAPLRRHAQTLKERRVDRPAAKGPSVPEVRVCGH